MLNAIMKRFDRCGDFVLRRFPSGDGEVFICYIRGLADREYLSSRVIKPIMEQSGFDGDFTACVQAFSVSPVNSADEAEKGLLDDRHWRCSAHGAVLSTHRRRKSDPRKSLTATLRYEARK